MILFSAGSTCLGDDVAAFCKVIPCAKKYYQLHCEIIKTLKSSEENLPPA
jgi:hypothetical protein